MVFNYDASDSIEVVSGTAPDSITVQMNRYQHFSAQLDLGSPGGSVFFVVSNNASGTPVYHNWTGSLTVLNGQANTAGSVFLTVSNIVGMTNAAIDTMKVVVSGAPTAANIYLKKWA